MSEKLTDSLAALQQLGAADYRAHEHNYASADGTQIRRHVSRKRAVYGTGAGVASVAAVGAIVFAASATGLGNRATFAPAATSTSPTAQADDAAASNATPSPLPSQRADDQQPLGSDGAYVGSPGQDAESILEIGAKGIGVSVEKLRTAVIAALPKEAGGNYEGWLSVRDALDLSDATADDLAHFFVDSTIETLKASGVAPVDYEETLIKASLIASELPNQSDYPMLAAVIDNRLANDMKLEFDSTVRFALRGEAGDFDDSPTQVDGRYNTYQNRGLPPGPVGSVSASAIDAVAHPAKSDALFFVTVNFETGETKFADTYAEQQVNLEEYVNWLREHPRRYEDYTPHPDPQ